MKIFIAAMLTVLLSASVASAAIYIKVKGDKGTVYWTDKGLSGYIQYEKDGSGRITFITGDTAYVRDSSPNGFVTDINGKTLDNYFLYNFNPDTGKYEYQEGDQLLTLPEDE
jgi:hypothetical protein